RRTGVRAAASACPPGRPRAGGGDGLTVSSHARRSGRCQLPGALTPILEGARLHAKNQECAVPPGIGCARWRSPMKSKEKSKDSKRHDDSPAIARRSFLKGATLAGAAAVTPTAAANAVPAAPQGRPQAAVPRPRQMALETPTPSNDPGNQTTSRRRFRVDGFKILDLDYLAMNCASSFRGLHEAVINYGNNTKPEILNCPHEDIAVHMAQGYAKMAGKPMAMICHGVVGLQHATMAMYNA